MVEAAPTITQEPSRAVEVDPVPGSIEIELSGARIRLHGTLSGDAH
jgi:hypothetical protein